MKNARPREASFWSMGIPSLKILTLAGTVMASPELSRTVKEISALSPRRTVPSPPLSWHRAGGVEKERQRTKGSKNRTIRRGMCSLAKRINVREELVEE